MRAARARAYGDRGSTAAGESPCTQTESTSAANDTARAAIRPPSVISAPALPRQQPPSAG